jgi:hypothetical protein
VLLRPARTPLRVAYRGENLPGSVLLSQGLPPQVPSALEGLTSVFGMGTGGSPPLSPPDRIWCLVTPSKLVTGLSAFTLRVRRSPRPIRIRQLNALLRLHLGPIYLVIYKGSYSHEGMGNLILRGASRLDAFSAYPVRTWLPSDASGDTTGTPAVRPSRSSRTKDSSSQISYARGR